MANIPELNLTFTDGTTLIDAEKMNAIVGKINDIVHVLNAVPVAPVMELDTATHKVSLSADSGVTIKYSINGSTPTTTYSNPIDVSDGITSLNAVATKDNKTSALPTITVKYKPATDAIEFASTDSGTIRYTTNGSAPTNSSTAYSSALPATVGTTYKLAVFSGGAAISDIAEVQITN